MRTLRNPKLYAFSLVAFLAAGMVIAVERSFGDIGTLARLAVLAIVTVSAVVVVRRSKLRSSEPIWSDRDDGELFSIDFGRWLARCVLRGVVAVGFPWFVGMVIVFHGCALEVSSSQLLGHAVGGIVVGAFMGIFSPYVERRWK